MKLILALVLSLTSSLAFARQMIQCSSFDTYSSDVLLVNLQTPTSGTLLISEGMEYPEHNRILVKIQFDRIQGAQHVFKFNNGVVEGEVSVPANVMGTRSDALTVELAVKGSGKVPYSCFSRIYND